MAKGEIKPFWATKQHDLRKLWILFDKFVIYINYLAPFPCVHHHSSQCSYYQGMTVTGRGFINTAWLSTWIAELLDLNLAEEWLFRSAR